MERLTIKERMASGRKQYIEKYKKQYQKEISLIRKGLSLANISAITGTSINTIRKVRILVREGRV